MEFNLQILPSLADKLSLNHKHSGQVTIVRFDAEKNTHIFLTKQGEEAGGHEKIADSAKLRVKLWMVGER